MPTWPVHVQDWQHECCGEPFGIGDRVRWMLVLTDESAKGCGWPDEMAVELRVVGRRPAESEEEGVVEVISTSVGPEVVVGPSVADNDVTVRESLIEEHHGRGAGRSTTCRGEFLRLIWEQWASRRMEPQDLIDAGDKVVASVRLVGVGRQSGVETMADAAHVWTFREGKIVRLTVFQTMEEALDAVGPRE